MRSIVSVVSFGSGALAAVLAVSACNGPTQPPNLVPPAGDAAAAAAAAAPIKIVVAGLGTVTLQDLGTLSGDAASVATSVNDAGQVVGVSGGGLPRQIQRNRTIPEIITPNTTDFGTSGALHAFAWTASGGMTTLANMSGTAGSVPEKNNKWGRIVGASYTTSGVDQVAVWATATSAPHSLSVPAGTTRSHGYDVDDAGNVVGEITNPAYGGTHTVAVYWPGAGGYTIIGGISGAIAAQAYSSARQIDNAGLVAGYAAAPDCKCADTLFSAFTWTVSGKTVTGISGDLVASSIADLLAEVTVGPIGSPISGGGTGGGGGGTTTTGLGPPAALDANGNMVGTDLSKSAATPAIGHGYRRTAAGVVTSFPTGTSAYGLDLQGRVVGTQYSSSQVPTAALFMSGAVYLLGTRTGDCCSEALALSNTGIAVGYSLPSGTANTGLPHAVRWTMPFTN
jgi:hypothetical protein